MNESRCIRIFMRPDGEASSSSSGLVECSLNLSTFDPYPLLELIKWEYFNDENYPYIYIKL